VNDRRIMVPLLVGVMVLGLLLGIGGFGTASADLGTTTQPSLSNSTTDPGTTTDPGDTDPGTVTMPGTTTVAGTTTTGSGTTTAGPGTTTDPGTTTLAASSTNPGTSGSAGTQPALSSSTTQSTPSQTNPTAPCDTTQITCGNNASTQVAIVSQNCNALSENATININVQTLSGNPVNNVTIAPSTTCLNEVAITQVVEQYCISCTIIIVPPPPPPPPPPASSPSSVYVTNVTNVTNVTTTIVTRLEPVVAYCLPRPVLQPNGAIGSLVYLDLSQPLSASDAGAVPATYMPGVGMSCAQGSAPLRRLRVPMFTLTVPASYVNQVVRLCVQQVKRTVCHDIRINSGATISVPVSSNVTAKVLKEKLPKILKSKSKAEIRKASASFISSLGLGSSSSKSKTSHPKPHLHVTSQFAKPRKGTLTK
jgi:hypothetical protein